VKRITFIGLWQVKKSIGPEKRKYFYCPACSSVSQAANGWCKFNFNVMYSWLAIAIMSKLCVADKHA